MGAKHGLPASTKICRSSRKARPTPRFRCCTIKFPLVDLAARISPGILKCFATHPPLLQHMMGIAEALLFADGHLTRQHKEMIATFVSVQNNCPYCADSHGYRLRVQGGSLEALWRDSGE